MPSFRKSPPETAFLRRCGLILRFTHLSSGLSANFVGELTTLQDQFKSEWNSEPVYGRMDPISTFQRTGRTVSLSWKILNEDQEIGSFNMIEIQKLISFLYPDYNTSGGGASTISGGPLLKLKYTNLVSNANRRREGLVGYLDGFSFDPDLESGYVSVRRDNLIPTVINASINFTVLHTHRLGWSGGGQRTARFPYGVFDAETADHNAAVGRQTKTLEAEAKEKTKMAAAEIVGSDGEDPFVATTLLSAPSLTKRRVAQAVAAEKAREESLHRTSGGYDKEFNSRLEKDFFAQESENFNTYDDDIPSSSSPRLPPCGRVAFPAPGENCTD